MITPESLSSAASLANQYESEKLDAHTLMSEVRQLAQANGCAAGEMQLRLVALGLQVRRHSDQTWLGWQALSRREKQVAALICYGLTSRQIAGQLVLSTETVKTHVGHILKKFNLRSRQDLRNQLSGWDFSRWLPEGAPLFAALAVIG